MWTDSRQGESQVGCSTHCEQIVVRAHVQPAIDSGEFRRRMALVGQRLHDAGVGAIYLADGGFGLADTFRWLARNDPRTPPVRPPVPGFGAHAGAPAWDCSFGEAYRSCFERAINGFGPPRIAVYRFEWSCENHHLGRADGAVRLIDQWLRTPLADHARILLWGHGEAGNVFALAVQLLSADRRWVQSFFEAAEPYYRLPWLGWTDVPVWERVRRFLERGNACFTHAIDVVTFGTFARYPWPEAHGKRLHFIYRRVKENRVPSPSPAPSARPQHRFPELRGDYVQEYGLIPLHRPSLFAWRARMAESRLARFLAHNGGQTAASAEGAAANDASSESWSGETVPVDYGSTDGQTTWSFAGHDLYTQLRWLLFHAEQVSSRFYRATGSRAA